MYPRIKTRVVIQRPQEVDRFTIIITEEEIREMVRKKFASNLIGPENVSLPEEFNLDVGTENPFELTISFDVEA